MLVNKLTLRENASDHHGPNRTLTLVNSRGTCARGVSRRDGRLSQNGFRRPFGNLRGPNHARSEWLAPRTGR